MPVSPFCVKLSKTMRMLQKGGQTCMGSALSVAELSILDWIALHCHSAAGDVLMPLLSTSVNKGYLWIAVGLAILLFGGKRRWVGLQIWLALILSVVICSVFVKNAVGRIRPCDLKPVLDLLITRPHDPSFPSGHTSASFAAAVVLWRNRCRGWQAAAVLACLIAFSRLYLYVHFPTDVLGGLAIGSCCGLLSVFLWNRYLEAGVRKLLQRQDRSRP